MMNWPRVVVLLLVNIWIIRSTVELEQLNRDEIAILQYDSRPLESYWLAAALWNKHYCDLHGHIFIYYRGDECQYDAATRLASPWCKVKAMRQANVDYPSVKLFIYMDSDAVIDKKFELTPVNKMMKVMQYELNWNPEEKPMVFNQDGPCWWCQLITRVGYKMCLNAGTVVWYRHSYSQKVLDDWWLSAMDSYADNPIKRKFRIKWPWEQDRQMAVYNRTPEHIQIASDPSEGMLVTRRLTRAWCLSHLPGNGCFISHHCSHQGSKQVLIRLYKVEEEDGLPLLSGNTESLFGFSSVRNLSHPFGFKVDYLTP